MLLHVWEIPHLFLHSSHFKFDEQQDLHPQKVFKM